MDNVRVIFIRSTDSSSNEAPTKMSLTIGSRRFQIDAAVRFSELPPIKGADVIPINRPHDEKGEGVDR